MQHRQEGEAEPFRNNSQIAEREIAFIQLAVGDALFDQLIDQLLHLLRRWFGKTPGGTFDNVGQTDDRAFLRLRLGPAVAETLLAHFGDVFFPHIHNLPAGPRVFLLLHGAMMRSEEFTNFAFPVSMAPPMITRYQPGMHYGAHTDAAYIKLPGGTLRSDLSCTIFLNEPESYEGAAR